MKKQIQSQILKTDPIEEEAKLFKKEIEKRYERNSTKQYCLRREGTDDSSDSSLQFLKEVTIYNLKTNITIPNPIPKELKQKSIDP